MASTSPCPPPDIQELPSASAMTKTISEATTRGVVARIEKQQHGHCKNDKDNDEDDDDNDSTSMTPCSRGFKLRITSNMLFVVASFLYVLLSVYDLNYANLLLSESSITTNYSGGGDDDNVASDMAGAGDDDVWLTKTKAKQTSVTAAEDYYYNAADDDVNEYESAADDDYYVFATKNGTWVSKYQIIYFVAALCFVMSGAVDFIHGSTLGLKLLSVIFILAGGFGLFSAMLVEEYEYLSNVFNSVSVHLVMVEAVGLFLRHCHDTEQQIAANGAAAATSSSSKQQRLLQSRVQCFVRFGDVSWIAGTFTDVILSYCYLRGTGNDSIPLSIASVVSATLWLLCSLIYLAATCIAERHARKQQVDISNKANETSSDDESLENPGKV
jgi:hypothetical protein